ncbi:helix-turn-helix domain-containing protein [Pediococcus pentosaceus]|nr:helix-turn-helix transcriptional regulator [Pediococcus pentosaceus]
MVKRFQFIRKNRKRKNLTIEQLAEKADVSIDLVARLERGEREDVSISKLESILHALDLELGDVFKHSK